MHREEQHEIVGCVADQGDPQRQLARQLEWSAELVGRQRVDPPLPVRRRQLRHILGSPTDLCAIWAIGKDLIGFALTVHPVHGAQNGVAGNDIVERGAQARLVQGARQPVGNADVEGDVARVHGLQKPHPTLAGRQWVAFSRVDRRALARFGCRHATFGDASAQQFPTPFLHRLGFGFRVCHGWSHFRRIRSGRSGTRRPGRTRPRGARLRPRYGPT